ncbi:MAG TPA: type II toxin-antitoxin system CcdA family antitoxin [Gammaproteobacteria bacterium]|nr:type II toxin-antitoxin system CcdA family antitoxin [Gammaproteobacteria bacterium]
MSSVKKTVSISKNIVKEVNTITSNFSAIVEAALIAYLHHYRIQKAVKSFGKWQKRKDSSINLVNDLRQLSIAS